MRGQPDCLCQIDETVGTHVGVVADDVREQHRVDGSVCSIAMPAYRVAHGVRRPEDRVGERHARFE